LSDGHAGAQDAVGADSVEHGNFEADQFAAEAGLARVKSLFTIDGDGVGDKAPTGFEPGPGSLEQWLVAHIAANENGVGGWLVR
jgi:hypothetical protein